MRGRTLLLSVLTAAALAPAPAAGASCCGGASALHPFVLPKWEKAMVGARLAGSAEFDRLAADGDPFGSTMRAGEGRLLVGGAWRAGGDWQLGASLPLVLRRVVVPGMTAGGGGLGDVSLSVRYEIMDEETCIFRPFRELAWNEIKPTVHLVLGVGLPTGRAADGGADPLGARVTGSGDLEQTLGLEVTKIWGAVGNAVEGGGGRRWPLHPGEDAVWQARASASLMWYPAFQRFLGVSAGWKGERSDVVATDSLRLEGIASWIIPDTRWWLRGNAGFEGLAGRNTPRGPTGGLTLIRLI